MALLLKNGAIFLHIPKTGGNWVTAVLNDLDLVERELGHKHADLDRLFASSVCLENPAFNSFLQVKQKPYIFCFVRNPLSWYESYFKYMSQTKRRWRHWGDERSITDWHPNAMTNGVGDENFNGFVRNLLRKRPGYVTELFGWYTKPLVDFVGKQEQLVDDLILVLKIMNVSFEEDLVRKFAKVGESPFRPTEWDPEIRQEAKAVEYSGFLRYGYDVKDI